MKNFNFNFKSIVQSMAREMDERVRTLKGASIQHPISIHSASIEHPLQSGGNQVAGKYLARIWKYAAMLLMVLTLGVGQMWGAWIGNSGINVNDTWYRSTNNIDGGNWLESCTYFQDHDFGAITSLELGGQYDTYDNNQTDYCGWNSSNGIHILIKKGSTTIEDFKLSCYHHEKSGNNVWKTSGGTNGCSDSGSWGTYTVDISEYAAGEYTIKATWFSPSGQSLNNTANFTIAPVVTFKANGGTGSDYTQTVTYNTNTTLTSNTFTKTGHSFAGWATTSDGNVTYANGGTVKLTAHTDLYAKWTPNNYTITYKDKGNVSYSGSNGASLPGSYTYGTGIATLTAGEKSGYVFDGWFDNEGCTGDPVTTISTTATGNKTFYAKFTQIGITLTAETGGQVSKDNSNWYDEVTITGISFGTNYNIYADPEDGYSFTGWTKGTNSSNTTLGDASDESTTVSVSSGAVTTLTAGFSEIMRTVNITGGTAASTTAGVSTTGTATVSLPEGKKFTGWSLGDGVTLVSGTTSSATITFHASQNSSVTATFADRASVKMYFAKPTTLDWGTLYAYAWKNSDASVKNAAYPGVEISTTEVVNNIVYYVYQYYTEADGIGGAATGNSAWNRIVFGCNNDAKKTGDLTIADGHYYYTNSTTTGSTSAVEHAWFLKGEMNDWGEDNPFTHDRSTNTGTVTINLVKGTTYEFKVYDQLGALMWSNSEALGGITNSVDATTLYKDDDNVMKITPDRTGSYIFNISYTNTTTPKLAVQYPGQFLVGSWDSWDEDDHMFDANGYVRVELAASTTYQFQVKYNGTYYGASGAGTITSSIKDWSFYTSGGDSYNVSITTTTAGYYVFGWNGADKKISVIYPADTTKAQLAPSKYIYFDARNLTAAGWWKDEFSTRFWLKNYASGVDITHVDCDIVDTVENKVFYALVPAEGQVGQVHLNRMKPDFTAIWSTPNKVHAVDRANTDQNCLKEETRKEAWFESWTPQWTKYCPPMTSATLTAVNAADKTVIYAGSGTKADPYIVATSANIYVSATSVSALNDANMTAYYQFKKTGVNVGTNTDMDDRIIEANSTNGNTDSITVVAQNYYSSTYGRVSPRSNAIYYTARTPYDVSITPTNVTKTSGATGAKAAVNNVAYVARFTADEGYNLPTSDGVVVLRSAANIIGNCTWSVSDGVGTLTVPAEYVTAALSISVTGVLKTYDITYDKGANGTGTLDGGTKTHGVNYTLSSNSTAFTRANYAYDGWATSDGGLKDYDLGGTYTTNAAQTFYPHWVAAYSVRHTLSHINCTSGATGSIAGVSGYNYVATFTAAAGYALPETVGVSIGGTPKTQGTHYTWSVSDGVGTLTVLSANVTGAIVVTISGTPVTLTFKKDAASSDWFTASNWSPACVPTINHDVVILARCWIEADSAQAKSVEIHNYGDTLGYVYIYASSVRSAAGGLVVAEGITAVHSKGGAAEATTKEDLWIDTDELGNGGLICGSASANTKAKYYFYTKARKYNYGPSSSYFINQYVGIPFASMPADQIYGFNIFVYDADADDWRTPSGEGANTMQPWTAYNLIRQYSNTDWNRFTLNGTLNLPGIEGAGRLKTLTCSSATDRVSTGKGTSDVGNAFFDSKGDYMFANSWTAPISIAALTTSDCSDLDEDGNSDIVPIIYIFNAGFEGAAEKEVGINAGTWSPFPFGASAYMENAVIPATQAFLVSAKVANATLTLDYKKHVYDPAIEAEHMNTYPTRAPRRIKKGDNDPTKLKIVAYCDSVEADNLYIFERGDFSEGYDEGWDGGKLVDYAYSFAPQLYAIHGVNKLGVDAIKEMDGTNLGFKAGSQSNEYTFVFDYNDDEPLYLYDKETNALTQITNEATYEFTTSDTEEHDRFLLTRSNAPQIATGVEEIDTENVQRAQKFMHNQQIFIRRGDKIYSIDGALVK